MTIDKQEIKALADLVKTDRRFCADEYHHALAEGVLALLAEISRIEIDAVYVMAGSRTRAEVIDQLKAENEALRRDAKRYRFLRNQHWPVAELAVVCNPKVSVKLGHDCPSGDRLDQQVDGAMIRGASHD